MDNILKQDCVLAISHYCHCGIILLSINYTSRRINEYISDCLKAPQIYDFVEQNPGCCKHVPLYMRLGFYDVKGSVCFVVRFALSPFSPPPPSEVQISKQNKQRTFDIKLSVPLYLF